MCAQDDQHARVLRSVDERRHHSGQPVRELYPVQSDRNSRVDSGHQHPEQLRTQGVPVHYPVVVQQSVFYDRLHTKMSVPK